MPNETNLTGGASVKAASDSKPQVDLAVLAVVERVNKLEGEVRNEMNEARKEYLNYIGIFVAFITFFSIEIQILKAATSPYQLFGLSSFMLGGILLFISLLINVAQKTNGWKQIFGNPIFVISLVCIVLGVVFCA
jgi:hypothetical protein